MKVPELLESILAPTPPAGGEDVTAVLERMERDERSYASSIDAAIVHAASADRLGYAFVAGYAAATRRLGALTGKTLPRGARISLCATEQGGGHPRAIRTALADGAVTGSKMWSTLAPVATHLLVIARVGERDGRPDLKAVIIPADRPGLSITKMPDPPFCPEIPHGLIELASVRVEPDEVVAGDGFAEMLRPFRTIEDLCVHASVLAWLGASGRRLGFDRDLTARALPLLLAIRELCAADPSSKAVHVALGGLLAQATALVGDIDRAWEKAPAADRDRWSRDKPLLGLASKVRAERLSRAWAAFDSERAVDAEAGG